MTYERAAEQGLNTKLASKKSQRRLTPAKVPFARLPTLQPRVKLRVLRGGDNN